MLGRGKPRGARGSALRGRTRRQQGLQRSHSRAGSAPGPRIGAFNGASGYRPALSTAAITRALELGAEAIYITVAPTRDGHLVLTADINLDASTDISKHVFAASRYVTHTILGQRLTGWFVTDFTHDELESLTYKEPFPQTRKDNVKYFADEKVLTLEDALNLIDAHSRSVALYLEFLAPSHIASLGGDYGGLFEFAAQAARWDPNDPRFNFVSAEKELLVSLRERGFGRHYHYRVEPAGMAVDEARKGENRGVYFTQEISAHGLVEVSKVADGIIIPLELISPVLPAGVTWAAYHSSTESVVTRARAANLSVGVAGLRAENRFRAAYLRQGVDPASFGDWQPYFTDILTSGVDIVFCDQPDLALDVRDTLS